jgi:hypothetical protein
MDSMADTSPMSDQAQIMRSWNKVGSSVCPLSPTESVLIRSSVDRPAFALQISPAISTLITSQATPDNSLVTCFPPQALQRTCALRI